FFLVAPAFRRKIITGAQRPPEGGSYEGTIPDDHVVVVRVAMDRRTAQRWHERAKAALEISGECRDACPTRLISNLRSVRPHHVQAAFKVPVELAMDGRMIERGERAVHLAEAASKVPQQRRRVPPHTAERIARNP